MLSEGAKQRILGLERYWAHPADEQRAVGLIADLIRSNEIEHPDEAMIFVRENGWSADDAARLGRMTETVGYTLKHIGLIDKW